MITGYYTYNQDGSRDWYSYDEAMMLIKSSELLSQCIQEKLATLNINSTYLTDTQNQAIGVKSSAKIYLEKVVYDGKTLVVNNSYTAPTTTPINLSNLTVEGFTFAGKSIFETLEGVLKSFGWRMYYYKGWRIERVLNIGKGTRMFKKYAVIGTDSIDINMVSIKDEGAGFHIGEVS